MLHQLIYPFNGHFIDSQTIGCPDEVDEVTLEKERAQREYAANYAISSLTTNQEINIFDFGTTITPDVN